MPAPSAAARPAVSLVVSSFAADALLVVLFAAVGRASHREAVDAAGLWITAWPFLAALVAGWVATLAWRAPARPVRTGVGVWAVTLVGGMLLRVAGGQGTALAFVIVAAVFLLLTLVGWRVVAAAVRRRRRHTTAVADSHSPE
jgi:hypothetical protein